MTSHFALTGKVALVVGGGGGLGRAIAEGLCEAGATCAVADLHGQRVDEVVSRLTTEGFDALGLIVDVTSLTSVQAMVDEVVRRFGHLDVLVNAAGITHLSSAEEFPEEAFDRVVAVNLKGTFLCCQVAGRAMLARGAGSIINLASIAGQVGLTETVAYCASKGGVVQITRALAVEWAQRGVRVNAIAPSWFAAGMGNLLDAVPGLWEKRVTKVPMGRLGKPEELKGAAIFLASDASSMITGHVLAVDGGFMAQ